MFSLSVEPAWPCSCQNTINTLAAWLGTASPAILCARSTWVCSCGRKGYLKPSASDAEQSLTNVHQVFCTCRPMSSFHHPSCYQSLHWNIQLWIDFYHMPLSVLTRTRRTDARFLSVCLSHCGTMSKQIHIAPKSSTFFYHVIGTSYHLLHSISVTQFHG